LGTKNFNLNSRQTIHPKICILSSVQGLFDECLKKKASYNMQCKMQCNK